jgi:hypothetical protein
MLAHRMKMIRRYFGLFILHLAAISAASAQNAQPDRAPLKVFTGDIQVPDPHGKSAMPTFPAGDYFTPADKRFWNIIQGQSAEDYDAAIRDATRRYRGDILIRRIPDPLVMQTVEEMRYVERTRIEPDAFAPKPFSLRTILPEALAPHR